MLAKFFASRFAGPVLLVMLALTLGSSFYALQQRALAAARSGTIDSLTREQASLTALIAGRDTLIASQNAGIEALAKAASANREVYIRQYAAADTQAKTHDDRAAQIMALPNDQIDELAQCRASRTLLEQELTQ